MRAPAIAARFLADFSFVADSQPTVHSISISLKLGIHETVMKWTKEKLPSRHPKLCLPLDASNTSQVLEISVRTVKKKLFGGTKEMTHGSCPGHQLHRALLTLGFQGRGASIWASTSPTRSFLFVATSAIPWARSSSVRIIAPSFTFSPVPIIARVLFNLRMLTRLSQTSWCSRRACGGDLHRTCRTRSRRTLSRARRASAASTSSPKLPRTSRRRGSISTDPTGHFGKMTSGRGCTLFMQQPLVGFYHIDRAKGRECACGPNPPFLGSARTCRLSESEV